MISLLLAGCVLASFVGVPGPAGAASAQPGRAIVVWREGVSDVSAATRGLEHGGMRVSETLLGGRAAVIEDAGASTEALVARLSSSPDVLLAEPDYPVQATAVPNDPGFARQWAYTRIQAVSAWDVERGDPAVVVAVIDTGADLDHLELIGRLDTARDRNFLVASTDPAYGVAEDDNGHGTHVAGIVAAASNNATGVAGTAPLVRVLPLKVLNASGDGDSSDVISAIEYAVSQDVDVINLSLAMQYGTQSDALHLAIQQATDAGIVVVAASGNGGSSTLVSYPAAYPECIAVGATGPDDARVSYSNAGTALDVMAPGGVASGVIGETNSILSTYRGGGYALMSGTSMATPFVSGTVALMRSYAPTITVDEVRSAIERTAKDIGAAGFDTLTGHGLLQMRNALEYVAGTDTTPPTTSSNAAGPYDDIASIIFSANDGAGLGVAATYCAVDGGALQRGSSVAVTGYGTHTLDFWSDDVVGNAETTRTATFFVDDTIAPVTSSDAKTTYDSEARITLSAGDGTGSGVQGTRYSVDGSVFTTGTVIVVPEEGEHTVRYQSVDKVGNTEALRSATFTVRGVPVVSRVAGDDRYATTVALSSRTYEAGSEPTIILASGEGFPDALSASALAGAMDAPLLLTARAYLPDVVAGEISRLGASKVIIVGGTPAVSTAVHTALVGAGLSVSRIAGEDRYATAVAVAERVSAETSGTPVVFLARGDNFPDALAASSIAATRGFPVLLTRTTALPQVTLDALQALGPDTVLITGSEAAVDAHVFAQVGALPGVSAVRLGGSDRYDTAAAIVDHGLGQAWVDAAFMGVATGANFPDALAGGVIAAEKSGILLLTAPTALSEPTERVINANGIDHLPVWVYGSRVAVADQVKNAIAALRF